MKTHLLLTAMAVLLTVLATAMAEIRAVQTTPDAALPRFEASVKRSVETDGRMSMRMEPMGRTMTGLPLRQLIIQAYGVQPNQLIGGPDWLTSDRWDIQLRADAAVAAAQMNLLIQEMLADRFKLVVHRETRDLPIFELRTVRTDGKPGPEMKPAAADCGPTGRERPGVPPPAPPSGREGSPGRGAPPLAGCRMMMTMGRFEANGQPLASFASFLSNQLGRPVIDKTGLSGGFDIVLSWTPDGVRPGAGAQNLPALPPGMPAPPPIDPNGPSLYAALQEQLGLKVESTRGPVEVLVIDSVQQPTEN